MKFKIGHEVLWKGFKMLVCEIWDKKKFSIGCKFWDASIHDSSNRIIWFAPEELEKREE